MLGVLVSDNTTVRPGRCPHSDVITNEIKREVRGISRPRGILRAATPGMPLRFPIPGATYPRPMYFGAVGTMPRAGGSKTPVDPEIEAR